MIREVFGIERSVNCVGVPRQAVSALNLAKGNRFIVTGFMIVSEQPEALETTSVTLYIPELINVWIGSGRVDVLNVPEPGSPKFQFQLVTGPPPLVCELSVKWTECPEQLLAGN
jgi:hypothetical protein